MQQDVTAKKDSIRSIQETNVIRCLARRVDHEQIPITKSDSIAGS